MAEPECGTPEVEIDLTVDQDLGTYVCGHMPEVVCVDGDSEGDEDCEPAAEICIWGDQSQLQELGFDIGGCECGGEPTSEPGVEENDREVSASTVVNPEECFPYDSTNACTGGGAATWKKNVTYQLTVTIKSGRIFSSNLTDAQARAEAELEFEAAMLKLLGDTTLAANACVQNTCASACDEVTSWAKKFTITFKDRKKPTKVNTGSTSAHITFYLLATITADATAYTACSCP